MTGSAVDNGVELTKGEPHLSNLAAAEFPGLVSWEEFQLLPERLENGEHYELHDGEVVVVPPPRPRHAAVQSKIARLLRFVEDFGFVTGEEKPYRPALNYQYWTADVMVFPRSILQEMMNWDEWHVYSPPLIIEVLSPSDRKKKGENTPEKIAKQRIVAMSNGTREFWVVDAENRTVHVTTIEGVRLYGAGELVPLTITPGKYVAVDGIFAG
jgi:Uma2 family endonuclease